MDSLASALRSASHDARFRSHKRTTIIEALEGRQVAAFRILTWCLREEYEERKKSESKQQKSIQT